MIATSLERKTRSDVYGILKKSINDAIAVRPRMTQDILKCEARRHKQKISSNKLLDKEEFETDKSEHQTSVFGLIYTTTVNGGIPKNQRFKIRIISKI